MVSSYGIYKDARTDERKVGVASTLVRGRRDGLGAEVGCQTPTGSSSKPRPAG